MVFKVMEAFAQLVAQRRRKHDVHNGAQRFDNEQNIPCDAASGSFRYVCEAPLHRVVFLKLFQSVSEQVKLILTGQGYASPESFKPGAPVNF